MTDEEHLREVIREREHTIKALHGNADAMERRIWDLKTRAEAAEKQLEDYVEVEEVNRSLVKRGDYFKAKAEAAEKREAALREALEDIARGYSEGQTDMLLALKADLFAAQQALFTEAARADAAEKLRDEALQERDEVWEDEEYLQKRIEAAERELSAAHQVAFNEGIRAKELEAALDGSPVASKLFVDLLKQKCDAEKARADAAEKERDEFRRALDKGSPPTIEAQSEINHWRERAKAMEKALQEIVDNTSERSLANNIARATLEAKP